MTRNRDQSLLANRATHLGLAAALAGLLVAGGDALHAGCDPLGSLVVGLRALVPALLLAVLQLVALRLTAYRGRRWQLAAAALPAVPLALWCAWHLAHTATIRAILPPGPAAAIGFLVIVVGLSAALVIHARALLSAPTAVALPLGAALAATLIFAASPLRDQHRPLALLVTLGAWLMAELALVRLLARARLRPRRWPLVVAAAAGILGHAWPLGVDAAFTASEHAILAAPLARLGRAEQLTPAFLADRVLPRPSTAAPEEPADPASPVPLELPVLPGRSVVLVSVDALRADHLGFMGYPRSTSPNLDRLAAGAQVFEQAFAPSPTSSFSIPSLHAGRHMEPILRTGAPLPATLAQLLSAAGYRTVGLFPEKIFSAGPELMGAVRASGFGFERRASLVREARRDAATLREVLAGEEHRPVFLWAHFYDPHLPYDCHHPPFTDDAMGCYDTEIRHLDEQLGRLLPWLDEQLDDPILIFTADHGEAFGEHGRLYHSADLYDEQIRVPLVFRIPGVEPGRIPTPVSIVDLAATITRLVVADPAVSMSGRDLRPLIAGRRDGAPVFAALGDKRAIVDGELKLICNGWPAGPCALYDRRSDPAESRNVALERREDATRLLARLEAADRSRIAALGTELPEAIVHGRLGRDDAAAPLSRLAGDPSSPHRIEAARLLALRKDDALADQLEGLLGSPTPEVGTWACVGRALLDRPCPVELVATRARDRSPIGSWSAIALARLGDPRARRPLERLLVGGDPILRAEAALALGALGDRRSVPALIALLEVKQSRWAAIEALGQLGDRRAAKRLEELRRDEPDQTNEPRYRRALSRIESAAE